MTNPLKSILSLNDNMVNLKRNVTNAYMSKFKLMFAKYLNKDGKLKAQKIRLIDTPIHPERPGMTMNNTTVPLGMIPIPLQLSYCLSHTLNSTRITHVALSWRFLNHHDSSRITMVLLQFTAISLRCFYESCRCITVW